jgi:CHASE3 domain sensor protein
VSLELVKATLAFFGALLGAVCGAYFKAWFDAKQAERRLRSEQQQTLLRPLVEATTTLLERLERWRAYIVTSDQSFHFPLKAFPQTSASFTC